MIRRSLSLLLMPMLAASVSYTTIDAQAQSLMTHHVRDAVRNGEARLVGHLPPEQTLSLDLVLALRDRSGLESFLRDLYDPASAKYKHFLTPEEFTARFGPTQTDYDAVIRFAKNNGFAVTGGTRGGMEVQIKGPVSAVEAAFHVRMSTYQHPTESRTFFGPDNEPEVDLPFKLWHISGMDNFSLPHPLYVKKSDYAAAYGVSPDAVSTHATTGSGPSASYLGSDMRAAYYGSGSLTGAGQNLGLFEYLGTDLADLTTYYNNAHQTNHVPITLLSTDGTSVTCVHSRAGGRCDDTEQTLDMTQALGMAPGLASMVVYIGSVDTAIISAMTTHNPLPTVIGCSWGWTPADPSTLDPYFQKMAAQGQNFFAASGDASTWSNSNEAWPADDAYVVSVGGTDLVTASAAGLWQSETAWVDSGGGVSPDRIGIPSWQKLAGVINSSNKGSTRLRNGPDVAANADFSFYTCANQTACLANNYGGTSFAAPMWAAYIALVNQQLASQGSPTLGFLNPTIYSQNLTSKYGADFHDIVSGSSGRYSAVTGYDLVTGWGSPKPELIAALTGSTTQTPDFTLSASPSPITIKRGASGTVTVSAGVVGGLNSVISLSEAGAGNGQKVSFSPASIAVSGSSMMTISVSPSASPTNHTMTITGKSGGTTHTITVVLTITR